MRLSPVSTRHQHRFGGQRRVEKDPPKVLQVFKAWLDPVVGGNMDSTQGH